MAVTTDDLSRLSAGLFAKIINRYTVPGTPTEWSFKGKRATHGDTSISHIRRRNVNVTTTIGPFKSKRISFTAVNYVTRVRRKCFA